MTTAAAKEAEPPLVIERSNQGVVTLRLNRPRHYNPLSREMMAALTDALEDIGHDKDVRAVVIEGAGRGFCAGHDLRELRSGGREFLEATFEQCSRLMVSITHLPQPVIAKVHGVASAAGCQLVATCDLAVASQEAKFGTPGVNIGLFCSTPMVAVSRNIGRKRAMEMLLLGETLSAEEAESFGLINKAVPESELDACVAAFCERLVAKSSLTLSIGKEAFYRQIDLPLEEAYRYTARVMTENMLARDAGEGIDAFLEKRPPNWEHR